MKITRYGKSFQQSKNGRVHRSGQAVIDAVPVTSRPRRQLAKLISFLPQQPIAPDEMTVAQWVRQGRFAHVGLLKSYSRHDEEAIQWALSVTELESFANPHFTRTFWW